MSLTFIKSFFCVMFAVQNIYLIVTTSLKNHCRILMQNKANWIIFLRIFLSSFKF